MINIKNIFSKKTKKKDVFDIVEMNKMDIENSIKRTNDLINLVISIFQPYKNKYVKDIIKELNINNFDKSNFRKVMINEILSSVDSNLLFNLKANNIVLKTIILNEFGYVENDIWLSKISIQEMQPNRTFINSDLYLNVLKKHLLFFVFNTDENNQPMFFDILLFNFNDELVKHAKHVFENTQFLFNNGDSINLENNEYNFIKRSDQLSFFVKARQSDLQQKYITQKGEFIAHQSFWLNSDLLAIKIQEQIDEGNFFQESDVLQDTAEMKADLSDDEIVEYQYEQQDNNNEEIIDNQHEANIDNQIEKDDQHYLEIIKKLSNENSIFWEHKPVLMAKLKKYNCDDLNNIFLEDEIFILLTEWIIHKMNNSHGIIKTYDLTNFNDLSILSSDNYYKIIKKLFELHKLKSAGDLVYYHRSNIDEFIKNKETQHQEIIKQIMENNNSFNIIASDNNVDIKDIENMFIIIKQLELWEDYFKDLFQKYDFSKYDFCEVFKLSENSYYYLNVKYTKGKLPIEVILNDKLIPKWIIKNTKDYLIVNDNIIINDEILIKQKELFNKVFNLAKNNYEKLSFEQFKNFYNEHISQVDEPKKIGLNLYELKSLFDKKINLSL